MVGNNPLCHRRAARAVALAVMSIGGITFAADTTYTGPATGTWNVAANWNNGVPTAGNNTFVDNGAAGNVTVNVTASATTGTLNISAGDMVVVNNTASLSLNGSGTSSLLNNAGELVLNGTTGARLRFINTASGVDAQITGGGTITLNGANAILDGTAAVRVVNTNNYIHGQGNIGAELITFDNHATIAADVNGGTLTLDPDGGSGTFSFMRNLGVMRATNGGILALSGNNGGTFNNSGTIEAQNNSIVQLVNIPTIVGGTITTNGSGSIRAGAGQNAVFSAVTNSGLMVAENNSDLSINTSFINNGTISIEAGANLTEFNVQNNSTLSGSGQLILSGSNASIFGPNDARFTNGVGHTIRGQGSIGRVTIFVTNAGTIVADVPGGTLELSADATAGNTAFINSGTLRATNGGTLVLNGLEGGFTNTGGLIEAQDGSQVRFINSANIIGGTLSSSGTGSLRVTAGNIEGFTDVTNNGLLVGENGSNITTAGTITNTATISIDSGANQTLFSAPADTTLAGAGTILLNGPLAGISGNDDRRLTNGPNHTIRGQGQIGFVTIWVTNQGTIASDVNNATLTLTADATAGQNAFINTGRLIATNGGILSLSGTEGGYTSTGGTIEAQNGSAVTFVSNASILGGTFVSTGTGLFRVPTGNQVLLNDVTLNGTLVSETNSNVQTFGPIVNNGTILLDSSGTLSTFLNVRAPTLLDGTGTLIMSGTTAFAGGLNDQRLTNGTQHTIRGQGTVGGTEIWVTNNGTILADVNGGSIVLAADGTAGNAAFINNGTVRATNGATINFGVSEGGFSGTGNIVADAGSVVNVLASQNIAESGPVAGEGTFAIAASANVNARYYRVANLLITSATARVIAGGGTLGTSKVSNLTLAGTARFDLRDHDLAIDYTGASILSTIRPLLQTGFNGGAWNGVGINSSSAGASTSPKTAIGYGEASQVLGPTGGAFSGVTVDGTSILLMYTVAGDADLSKSVNLDDFTRLAAAFGTSGNVWSTGDFNYDGNVNLDDFTILAANFGLSIPADMPRGAAVPEPVAATGLAILAMLTGSRRRRTT